MMSGIVKKEGSLPIVMNVLFILDIKVLTMVLVPSQQMEMWLQEAFNVLQEFPRLYPNTSSLKSGTKSLKAQTKANTWTMFNAV